MTIGGNTIYTQLGGAFDVYKRPKTNGPWVKTTGSPPGSGARLAAVDDNIVYGSYYCTYLCVEKTVDGGSSWTSVYTNTLYVAGFGSAHDISVVDANVVYAAQMASGGSCTSGYCPIVAKTTNGGSSWTVSLPETVGSDSYAMISIDAVDANTVYVAWRAGSNTKVARTTNGGSSWSVSTVGPAAESINTVSVSAVDASTAWVSFIDTVAGTTGVKVARTTNGGSTWTITNGGNQIASTPYYQNMIAVDSNTAYVVYSFYGTSIAKTTDGGATWKVQTVSELGGGYNAITATDPNNIYVVYQPGIGNSYNMRMSKARLWLVAD